MTEVPARLLTEIKTEPRTAQERGSTQINILKNTPLITPSAHQQKFRQAATQRGQGRSKDSQQRGWEKQKDSYKQISTHEHARREALA